MNSKSSTYCKMAHLGLNCDMSGMVQPCTISTYWIKDKENNHLRLNKNTLQESWDNDGRKQFVKNLDDGIRQDACSTCWNAEDSGARSYRMIWNKMLKDVEPLESQPRVLVVKPGNKCNNACRSCNAHTSSAWYKDAYKMSGTNKDYKTWLKFFKGHDTTYKENNNIESQFSKWQDNILFWDLYGGEPLIIPMTYTIIKDSIAKGTAKHQGLQIHTNGTVYDPELIKMASNFKSFSLGYSIDAVGVKNDYVRKLSKWDNVLSNLISYKKEMEKYENMVLSIRSCATPFNVYYIDELYDFFVHQQPVNIGPPTLVQDVPHTDISYLPTNVKEKVLEKLLKCEKKDDDYMEWIGNAITWLQYTPKDHEEKKNSFLEFNNKLDIFRKEKFEEVMPEYASLFNL